MLPVFLSKLKESCISVLPVALLIFAVTLTPWIHLTLLESVAFLGSAIALLLGLAFFNMGAELAMTPMGECVGAGLTKGKKPFLLLAVCFLLGLCVTIAEPDLTVLATQVKEAIDGTLLTFSIGAGVGAFLVLAVLRMIFKKNLSTLLLFCYMFLFSLSSLVVLGGNAEFLSVAFDSGGVTTGPMTVPFLMALGVGVASTLGGKNSKENSFGLIALCSVGPVLAVVVLGIFFQGNLTYETPDYSLPSLLKITEIVLDTMKEVGVSLSLLMVFFTILQIFRLHLPKEKLLAIAVGLAFTFAGLVLFLSAIKIGFMPVGYQLGVSLSEYPVFLAIIACLLGMVSVLAEPAVQVLNRQVEDVTEGTVKHRSMRFALSVGVGIALLLSVVRIFFNFNILYYLIPGYLLSFALSFFVPRIYTAIAFDSGGVASGPLMSGFVLPFAVGACITLQGTEYVLTDAFGVVAMVALAPLVSIQILGFKGIIAKKIKNKSIMRRIFDAGDEQIIHFMEQE